MSSDKNKIYFVIQIIVTKLLLTTETGIIDCYISDKSIGLV